MENSAREIERDINNEYMVRLTLVVKIVEKAAVDPDTDYLE